MIDVERLSTRYVVRLLDDSDIDTVLNLYKYNDIFYQYTSAEPTRAQVINDMHLTPPGIDPSDKYYVGFFERDVLVAIMDVVDGYPKPEIAYIGLFMVDRAYQGQGIGTSIIEEAINCLITDKTKTFRLAIDQDNPQSTHFWDKMDFTIIDTVEVEGWTKLVAERTIRDTGRQKKGGALS